MKSKERQVSLSTVLLLALLTASLSACGGETAEPIVSEDSPAETTEAVTETAEVKDPLMDDLGEFDFDGYTFRVLSATYDPAGTFTLFDTEQNGEALNDSLYTRNREIEERFNIVFEASEKDYDPCYQTLRKNVNAGEDAYDLIMLINRNAFSAALEGMLMPTEELTYLNPEKSYYLHDINDAFSIAGKSLFYYSEESVYTFERAVCLAFNKRLAAQYDLPDYYSMVKNGTWTQDVLYRDAKLASVDLNGDSAWTTDDQYGLLGHYGYLLPSLFNLSGEVVIGKDQNDIPYFNGLTSEVLATSVSKILNEMNSGNYIFVNPKNKDDVSALNTMFANGNSLFFGTVIGRLFALRDMKDDFGILPYPKLNEQQETYYTRVVDAWLHVCPVTNADPARTSVIMEALASGSARYVFPAYYEKAVQQKVMRDAESAEMMDIIRATRIVDLGECPWLDTVHAGLETSVLLNQSKELASYFASIEGKVNAVIEEAVAAVKGLQNQ